MTLADIFVERKSPKFNVYNSKYNVAETLT